MPEDSRKKLAYKMMDEGAADADIVASTKLPMNIVTRMRGYYNSPSGKWVRAQQKNQEPPTQAPATGAGYQMQEPPQQTQGATQPLGSVPSADHGLAIARHTGDDGREGSLFSSSLQEELMLAGTPIIRKVILNPKIFFWYDFAANRMGFKGDIGDFVNDCVEDFFKSRNYEVIVQKRDVVRVS
jgi:hypothetical protein